MHKIVIVSASVLVIAGISIFILFRRSASKEAHFHAGFKVFVDGRQQNFSDMKYMHVEVCSAEGETHEVPTDSQDIVHLHDNIGDVAHIHADNATWGMLLGNLGVSVKPDQKVLGYKKGRVIEDILSLHISPNESVLIYIGKKEDGEQAEYVSQNHIEAVEKKSENCN